MQKISELEHAVFDAQGCSILEDFHLRFRSVRDSVESLPVEGIQGAPLALVGALQRELAVAEEIGRLRRKVECLDVDATCMTNELANQISRRRGD